MPTVKIELSQGKDKDTLIKIKDLVMDAVAEALQLKPADRNVRLLEYDSDFFEPKPPYEIMIEIALISGRTPETKKKVFSLIVENLETKLGIERTKVFIVLNEQPKENWGIRGGIPASELIF